MKVEATTPPDDMAALLMRAEQAEKLASDRLAQMQQDRSQALKWRDEIIKLGGKP